MWSSDDSDSESGTVVASCLSSDNKNFSDMSDTVLAVLANNTNNSTWCLNFF